MERNYEFLCIFARVKKNTGSVVFVLAFILLWACTPSALFKHTAPDVPVEIKAPPSAPKEAPPSAPEGATMDLPIDSLSGISMATIPPSKTMGISASASDSLLTDSLIAISDSMTIVAPSGAEGGASSGAEGGASGASSASIARAAMKRDTTTMDSLELAIFKYNQVIDDSLRRDSLNRQKKNGIDAPVVFSATDSLIYEASTGMAHLFGSSHVEYQNMDLKSDKIYMCLDSSLVHATGSRDSLGEIYGTPVFKMGSDTYENDTMAFNFKTKKGLIQQVYTQQEDGFLTAEIAKRGANGELFLQHGKYTTCDDPHPDFYIAMSRAKVRPGKDVVFGPAYLVVCDVPIPLAIPYGFFPFSKSYSSGFIMPTYGDETERGFYLRDGGYYFAVSDFFNDTATTEIYTKGSWGLSAASNYHKRYKYSGSFYLSYQDTKNGDKGMPDFTEQESFKIQWNHRQDAKSNPFSTLSASVNFATSSYERNNLTSMYNPQAMTQSTRTSSVNWSTTFSSIGMTISTNMNLNQNMRDSTIALTLPDLNISISRFYPFKRKKAVGEERWYEKISMSYTGHLSNEINTKEDQLLHANIIKDWKNGMRHQVPISASFTVLNYINITPSFSFTDRMYSHKIMQEWDQQAQAVRRDTIYGFNNVYNYNMSISANTKLYGFWTPLPWFGGKKIQAIRHVFTPTVSFSYAPDFGQSRFGYWDSYVKTDKDGNVSTVLYSPYQGALYGTVGRGKTGSVTLDVSNNVEMKVRSDRDSTGDRKISLIDELGASLSYNMAAKTRPWSDLSMRVRLKLTKSYTFSMNAVFATYAYEVNDQGNVYVGNHTEWSRGRFGRFQGMSQNLSYTINNDTFRKLFGKKDKKSNEEGEEEEDETDPEAQNVDPDRAKARNSAKSDDKQGLDEDGYVKFQMPWSLTVSYGVSLRENTGGHFHMSRMRYGYKLTHTLNFSGNLRISHGWNINFSSGYDFNYKRMSMTTASVNRDLHCFSMGCSMVIAPYRSYNFTFACNAGTLADVLRWKKQSSYSSNIEWY